MKQTTILCTLILCSVETLIVPLDGLNAANNLWSTTSSSSNNVVITDLHTPLFGTTKVVKWDTKTTISGTGSNLRLSLTTTNWVDYTHLEFWMCNTAENITPFLNIKIYNTNTANTNYYSAKINIDWKGWEKILINLKQLKVTGSSRTVSNVNFISFSLSKQSNFNATFYIREVKLVDTNLVANTGTFEYLVPQSAWDFNVPIALNNTVAMSYDVKVDFIASNSTTLQSGLRLKSISIKDGSLNVSNIITAAFPSSQVAYQKATVNIPSLALAQFYVSLQFSSVAKVYSNDYHYILLTINNTAESVNTEILIKLLRIRNNPLSRRNHPNLYLNRADFTDLSANLVTNILSTADTILSNSQQFAVPPFKGRWLNYWNCGFGGGSPVFDPNSFTSFKCPNQLCTPRTCPELAGAWISLKLSRLVTYTIQLGLAANIESARKADYINATKSILYDFARTYPTYGYSTNMYFIESPYGGRMTEQTLDESGLLIELCWALDMVGTLLDDSIVTFIKYNLIAPAANTIKWNKAQTSNWQGYHNAGMFLAGIILNDENYTNIAVNDPSNGFKFQMTNSLMEDGFWYEGSIGYHYFVLEPLVNLALVATRMWKEPLVMYDGNAKKIVSAFNSSAQSRNMISMFLTPLHLLLPNGQFPAINDMGLKVGFSTSYFEMALACYPQNEMFRAILKNNPRTTAVTLRSWTDKYSLQINSSDNPTPEFDQSVTLKGLGFHIIKTSESDYVTCKGSKSGGWHGHADKLGLIFFSNNISQIMDPGVSSYTYAVTTDYLKKSLSHSTLMFEGENQLMADGWIGYVDKDLSNTYSGVIYKYGSVPVEAQRFLHYVKEERILVDIIFPYSKIKTNASLNVNYILHSPADTFQVLNNKTIVSASTVHNAFKHVTGGKNITPSALDSWIHVRNPAVYSRLSSQQLIARFNRGNFYYLSSSFELDEPSLKEWSIQGGLLEYSNSTSDGKRALRWRSMNKATQITWNQRITDWTWFSKFCFDVYCVKSTNKTISLILNSRSATNPSTASYFIFTFTTSWAGYWKNVCLDASAFRKVRNPVGWNKIDNVIFSSMWSEKNPDSTSELLIDNVYVLNNVSQVPFFEFDNDLSIFQPWFSQKNTLISFEGPIADGTFDKSFVVGRQMLLNYDITINSLLLTADSCSTQVPGNKYGSFIPFITLMSAYGRVKLNSKICTKIWIYPATNSTIDPFLPQLETSTAQWLIHVDKDHDYALFYWFSGLYPYAFTSSLTRSDLRVSIRGLEDKICYFIPKPSVYICLDNSNPNIKISADIDIMPISQGSFSVNVTFLHPQSMAIVSFMDANQTGIHDTTCQIRSHGICSVKLSAPINEITKKDASSTLLSVIEISSKSLNRTSGINQTTSTTYDRLVISREEKSSSIASSNPSNAFSSIFDSKTLTFGSVALGGLVSLLIIAGVIIHQRRRTRYRSTL